MGLGFKLQAQTWGLWVDSFKAEFGFGASLPLAGAHAEVNQGDSRKRITATRMAAFGPFSLAMKKNAGHAFLVFTAADGRQMTKKVDPKDIGKAIQFAAQFNSVAARLAMAANDET